MTLTTAPSRKGVAALPPFFGFLGHPWVASERRRVEAGGLDGAGDLDRAGGGLGGTGGGAGGAREGMEAAADEEEDEEDEEDEDVEMEVPADWVAGQQV